MGTTQRKLRPRLVLHQQTSAQAQFRLRSMTALTPASATIDPPATSAQRLILVRLLRAGALRGALGAVIERSLSLNRHGSGPAM
jgi:hypothetical protein